MDPHRRRRLAYWELAAAMVMVGSSFVAARVAAEALPVFLASALRYGLALLALGPLALKQRRGPFSARRDGRSLVLMALTGVFGFSVLMLFGLRHTTAGNSGLIASVTPAVVALVSVVLLRERLARRGWLGVACAVGGVAALTAFGATEAEPGAGGGAPLLGNALVFGAVIGEALFLVLGREVASRLGPLVVSASVIAIGFVLFLPFAFIEARGLAWGEVESSAWLAVAYYAVGPTVFGYLLAFDGLARVPASAAGTFTGLVPLSALALGAALLGESVGWGHLLGGAGVLAGIALGVGGAPGAGGGAGPPLCPPDSVPGIGGRATI